MSDSQSDSINSLKEKVKRVLSIYWKEKEKNEKLTKENHDLASQLKMSEKKVIELTNKYQKLKLAKTVVASSRDAHDAKLKVNTMVREIDRCIALLNR